MRIEDFRAGSYKQQREYQSFSPSSINHEWIWETPEINTLLADVESALGRLDAFSLIAPDMDLFIVMHEFKEATTSSRIEGTKTRLDEALMERDAIPPEKRDDWQEVQNYVSALNEVIEVIRSGFPLCNRLLKQAHATLMKGVRGQHRDPGQFRRSQNWIGGATLKDAVFIPPSHEEVPELMSDLEKFLQNDMIQVPELIRIAIAHYQFETIHPFLDGNGRIGRLLVPLYLICKGKLQKPSLYISDHIEKNKHHYYDALTRVRISDDLVHWVKFFLVAMLETCKKATSIVQQIRDLQIQLEQKLETLGGRSGNAQTLLRRLFRRPFITVRQAADDLDISYPTASRLIGDFVQFNILRETIQEGRTRQYVFAKYLGFFLD